MTNTLSLDQINELFTYNKVKGQLRWKVQRRGKGRLGELAGTVGKRGYWVVRVFGKNILVHRIIYFIETGEWPRRVDHRDGVTTNNVFSNLRPSTGSQNIANAKKHKDGATSPFKGVFKMKSGRFMAGIGVNYKRLHLGVFTEEIDAAKAYNAAAIKHFGEFARLNEIPA